MLVDHFGLQFICWSVKLYCLAGDDKADASAAIPPTDRYKALRANYDFVKRYLQLIKSDDAYKNAAKMLRVLGFDDAAQQRSLSSLSGGLRMRVALSAAFFIEPDLLLLVREFQPESIVFLFKINIFLVFMVL